MVWCTQLCVYTYKYLGIHLQYIYLHILHPRWFLHIHLHVPTNECNIYIYRYLSLPPAVLRGGRASFWRPLRPSAQAASCRPQAGTHPATRVPRPQLRDTNTYT